MSFHYVNISNKLFKPKKFLHIYSLTILTRRILGEYKRFLYPIPMIGISYPARRTVTN